MPAEHAVGARYRRWNDATAPGSARASAGDRAQPSPGANYRSAPTKTSLTASLTDLLVEHRNRVAQLRFCAKLGVEVVQVARQVTLQISGQTATSTLSYKSRGR